MTPIPEAKHLARAIRQHSKRSVDVNGQTIVKGIVRAVSPLVVEPVRGDILIEADHLLLGAWARFFDATWGIAVDDTVLMTRMADNDWYVMDVISDKDLDGGFDLASSATATVGAAVGRVPYRDVHDAIVGYVLIHAPS